MNGKGRAGVCRDRFRVSIQFAQPPASGYAYSEQVRMPHRTGDGRKSRLRADACDLQAVRGQTILPD